MPSYEQLEREAVWNEEIIPTELVYLRRNLLNFWDIPAASVGLRGDNKHMRGYHRSRNWIVHSMFSRDRDYSVIETYGNRHLGDGNWIAAMDITLPRDRLIAVCKRLDNAVRAGLLEKVTEWYGNADGDGRVDGYDNIADRIATSDPSHLWHLHISFDRGRVNENHDDIFGILTGRTSVPPRPTTPKRSPRSQEWTEEMLRSAPTLRMGDTGMWVRTMQGCLVARGFDTKVDGEFGQQTRAHLVLAQRQYGAERIDAVCGPETWTILFTGKDQR